MSYYRVPNTYQVYFDDVINEISEKAISRKLDDATKDTAETKARKPPA